MSTLVSEKIKEIRKAEGITQKFFCELCNFSIDTFKNYENNRRVPNYESIQKICNAFPQYMEYLMLDEMREPRTPGQITPQEKNHLDSNSQVKNA